MQSPQDRFDVFAETAGIPSVLQYGDPGQVPSPAVTVIMPVYHRPDLFALALDSVLQQDFAGPYEVLVVDNHEADPSPNLEVVRRTGSHKVLYYHNAQNLGMFGNWNRGITLARAPFVSFCHDDDLLLPGALSRLMELQPLAGKACILSAFHEIDGEGRKTDTTVLSRRVGPLKPRGHFRYSFIGQVLANVSCGDGCLYGREQLLSLGGYDSDYYPSSDYELNIHYARRFGAWINNVPTSCYRVSDNESMQVFRQFPAANRRVQEKWLLPDGKPRWLVRRLIGAVYRNATCSAGKAWASEPDSAQPADKVSLSDRALLWMARTFDRVHKYTLL